MRISDWSSDVCSSRSSRQVRRTNLSQPFGDLRLEVGLRARADLRDDLARAHRTHRQAFVHRPAFGKARQEPRGEQVADRKSVVSGKSVSVRVDLGGRRIIKKKNTTNDSKTNNKI